MRTMCLAKSHTAAKVVLDLTLRWVNGSDRLLVSVSRSIVSATESSGESRELKW